MIIYKFENVFDDCNKETNTAIEMIKKRTIFVFIMSQVYDIELKV